jgi:hypothetical protein
VTARWRWHAYALLVALGFCAAAAVGQVAPSMRATDPTIQP